MRKTTSGFTIVELLIVIVVIAVLAAITVLAYNGIQDRAANNTSVNAANHVEKLVRSYMLSSTTYPGTTRTCAVDSGCYFGSAVAVNATFQSNLATIGTLPSGPAPWSTTYGGIIYDYLGTRTYEGVVSKIVIIFFLKGANKNCGRDVGDTTTGATLVKSTTGNSGSVGATTLCSIPLTGIE